MLTTTRGLYLLGWMVNLLFLAVLTGSDHASPHLQLPEGEYQTNIWRQSDVMTYVRPARSFLETGAFLRGQVPDYHRTIGYPFFLSVMMAAFGALWVPATQLVQAAVFALIYPILWHLALVWFPGHGTRVGSATVMCSFLSAAGFAYTAQFLTDQFFTVLFVGGVLLGSLAITRGNWWLLAGHVGVLGYAAQVRPTLGLYPVANIFLLLALLRRQEGAGRSRGRWMIAVSTLLLLAAVNLPAIRNYRYHGFFAPTDVAAHNVARYLAKNVLMSEGQGDVYRKAYERFESVDVKEQMQLEIDFAADVCRQYPFRALQYVAFNAAWNLLEPHWNTVFWYWRASWRTDGRGRFLRAPAAVAVAAVGALFYLTFHALFLRYLWQRARARDPWMLAGLLLLLLPLAVSFLSGEGARMRLYAEGIMLMCAWSTVVAPRGGTNMGKDV